MTDALGAGERASAQPPGLGYRSGYYSRTLIHRAAGKLELRVPQDRDGRFSTELFERYQRSWNRRSWRLWPGDVRAGRLDPEASRRSPRNSAAIRFSASAISAIQQASGRKPRGRFAGRPLEEPFRFPRRALREGARGRRGDEPGGADRHRPSTGTDASKIPAVEMANRESRSSWKDFLIGCANAASNGVELVVADDHAGLRSAIREVLSDAAFQRCYVHFLLQRPRSPAGGKADDDCLQELRWLLRPPLGRRGPPRPCRLDRQMGRAYPRLVAWVEETIEETLTFYRLPRQHHKHLKSTNMLERLNEEIRRRTYVVRIFPQHADACRRLGRALAVETHENWLEAHRYLNMNDLKEHKKIPSSARSRMTPANHDRLCRT